MKTNITTSSKFGLYKLGYIENANLNDLNNLIGGNPITLEEISALADNAQCVFLNKYGYSQSRDGYPILEKDVKFRYFDTGLKDKNNDAIIGVLERSKTSNTFVGMQWCSLPNLMEQIKNGNKFHFGELYFDDERRAFAFLEDLAINSQPEDWVFQHKPAKIQYPILKSYIENIFIVLKHESELGMENRLVYSKDRTHLLFNTNLLDRYAHEIWIILDVKKMNNGKEMLLNPKRVKSERELSFIGFERGACPNPPSFFKHKEEAHYQKDWEIAYNYDTYEHIIQERQYRFAEEYRQLSSEELAGKLDEAIRFGVEMAKRNDHFVLPMYRPQKQQVQMLMPIYLNRLAGGNPDFALVLSLDKENRYYLPETILSLEDAYQDARLISILDGMWLTPKNA